MMKPGIKRAAFGFRYGGRVVVSGVQKIITVAVMLPGGCSLVAHGNDGIHRHGSIPVLVAAGMHLPCDDLMPRSQPPNGLLCAVIQSGGLVKWQGDVKGIIKLTVGKNDRIQPGGAIEAATEPYAHFRQQTLDKLKVSFTPLGNQLAGRISMLKTKLKIAAFKPVRP